MLLPKRAGRCLAVLALAVAAACSPPPPTTTPATATPNSVQTALALLTASFASLTPTASDVPSETLTPSPTPPASETATVATATASQTVIAPTVTPTQTLRVLETRRVSTITPTPSQTLRVKETLRVSTVTPTPRITATHSVSTTASLTATASFSATATITPTAPLRIVPGNAISLTQAAVLGPLVLSGTRVAKLDQVAWAPDGQLAAAGAAGVLFAQGDALTTTHGYTMGAWTPSLSFSTDRLALALSSVGGTVRLFNRANGALLFQLVHPSLRVSQVRYRPGPPGVLAQYLASLGGDNTVYVWDVAYKKFLGTLSPGPSSAEELEISGDGRWLAAASGNDVLVWDMNALPATGWTPPLSPTLTVTQDGAVAGLALSRDGLFLAASNDAGTIELWTLPAGQKIGAFARLSSLPQRLAFSPDGRLIAAAYGDKVIRIWSLAATPGTDRGQVAAPLAELAGHTALITSVAFSPDGAALASSSWDGTVRVWKVGSSSRQ